MRLPSPGIRPPGAPTSIRPPKNPDTPRALGRPGATRPPGGSGRPVPRLIIGATICAVVISLALAGAHAIRSLLLSHAPITTATDSQADKGCSASASLGVSEDLRLWEESWRMDSGAGDWFESPDWTVFSQGDCLILSTREESSTTLLRGYRITESGPVQLWESRDTDISEIYEGLPWWGGRIPVYEGLLDPATGEVSDAPWPTGSGNAVPIDEELIVVCGRPSAVSTEPPTCSAWEWNEGSPSERWSRTYTDSEDVTPLRGHGVGGGPDQGSVVVSTDAGRTVSFMSLADGTVRGMWPTRIEGQESPAAYIPASDGWVRVDESRTQATAIGAQGREGETFAISRTPDALLLVDGQEPTVDQFRRAYESGDTSWADTVLHCEDLFECTLNGSPIALPRESFSWQGVDDGAYQGLAVLSADRHALLIRTTRRTSSPLILIDIDAGTATVPAHASASVDQGVVRMDEDLIITIEGSEVVGHRPVQ